MLTTKTVSDGSGRLTVVEHDDRGEPEQSSLPVVGDFRGCANYSEQISIPLSRDGAIGRGSARLGMFLFSANVNPGSGVVADYTLLDCIVTGYIGAAGTTIKRMAFGPGAPDDFLRLDDSNNYDRIAVLGRQVVNGAGDSVQAFQALNLQVTGRYSR